MSPWVIPAPRKPAARHPGRWLLLLGALAASGLAALELRRMWGERPRDVVLALDAEEVRALSLRQGYSRRDFYERAKTIGVAALELRDLSLGERLERGAGHHFSYSEVAKLKALEIVLSDAPLSGNEVWTRSDEFAARVAETARAAGVKPVPSRVGAWRVLEFAAAVDPRALTLGPDPADLETARALGLTPVFDRGPARTFSLAAAERLTSDDELFAAARWRPGGPGGAGLLRTLAEKGRWLIVEPGDLARLGPDEVAELPAGTLTAADVRVAPDDPLAAAAPARGASRSAPRYLRLRLAPGAGVEENLGWIRSAAQDLRSAGYRLSFPFPGQDRSRLPRPHPPALELAGRMAAAALVLFLVPFAALRLGLLAARARARWGALAGFLAVAAAAALAGLWAHAALSPRLFRLGLGASPGLLPAVLGGLAFAGFALYTDVLREGRRRFREAATQGDVARWALGAAVLLWAAGAHPGLPVGPYTVATRAAFLGYPALLLGLILYHRRLREGAAPEAGARFLLLLALAAPAETALAFARPWVPFWVAVGDAALSAGLGLVLGALLGPVLTWAD